jgi:hypothetical protein
MGENGVYGGNVEIIAIIEIYNLSVSVNFVTESQMIQPLTVTFNRAVAETNVYPDYLTVIWWQTG